MTLLPVAAAAAGFAASYTALGTVAGLWPIGICAAVALACAAIDWWRGLI